MYCYKGNKGYEDLDTSDAVYPLYNVLWLSFQNMVPIDDLLSQLTKEDWWFHHVNKVSWSLFDMSHTQIVPFFPQCDEFPPAAGDYLIV